MTIGQHFTSTTAATLKHIVEQAESARRDLGQNASGSSAHRTLERLASIERLATVLLETTPTLPPIPNHEAMDKSDVAELLIVGRLVTDLLAAGYTLSVYDGEETTVEFSTTADPVFEALASTDQDILYAHMGATRSFVMLVWGNGVDVISDYGTSLESVIKGANDLATELDR